jgi:hypothetical protein
MDSLFEEFIKERRYLRNLAESTLTLLPPNLHFFQQVGAFEPLTKKSLQNSLIAFRDVVLYRAINTYIRGIIPFELVHEEHN